MKKHLIRNSVRIPVVILALACVVSAPTQAQSPEARPQFEVASIKPSSGDSQRSFIGISSPGTFTAEGVTLRSLIMEAYGIRGFQVLDSPGWIDSVRYDITAKPRVQHALEQMTRESNAKALKEMDVMLQALLEDRFQLKIHRETRELPVFALIVAKSGLKLHETHCTVFDPANPPAKPAADQKFPDFCGNSRQGKNGLNRTLDGTGIGMNTLTEWALPSITGRAVIDKTGLTGKFDVHLEWAPDDAIVSATGPGGLSVADPALPSTGTAGPPIFIALQEQLGLGLEPTKAPLEVIVVDRAEKASAN